MTRGEIVKEDGGDILLEDGRSIALEAGGSVGSSRYWKLINTWLYLKSKRRKK